MNRENKRKTFEKGYYKTHACNDIVPLQNVNTFLYLHFQILASKGLKPPFRRGGGYAMRFFFLPFRP